MRKEFTFQNIQNITKDINTVLITSLNNKQTEL